MTLLEAVDSLALIEANAVSCIHVVPLRSKYVAFFTIAILLPLVDTDLPDEFRAGEPRLWRDQARLLDSKDPIEDQILDLERKECLAAGFEGKISQDLVAIAFDLGDIGGNGVDHDVGLLGHLERLIARDTALVVVAIADDDDGAAKFMTRLVLLQPVAAGEVDRIVEGRAAAGAQVADRSGQLVR